jgi:hypothetical protein
MSNGPTVRVVKAMLASEVEKVGPGEYDVIEPLDQIRVTEFPRPDLMLALVAEIERQPGKPFMDVTAEIVDAGGAPVTQPKTAALSTQFRGSPQTVAAVTVEFEAVHLPAAGAYRARLSAGGSLLWEHQFTAILRHDHE